MSSASTIDVLNRLVVFHQASLPMYLRFAAPYLGSDGAAADVLQHIASDQEAMADRLAQMVLENGGTVVSGEFPMTYTGYHDLGLEFLRARLVEQQRAHIRRIQESVERLALVPMARALAEEALGEAKGHLQSLEEISLASAPAHS